MPSIATTVAHAPPVRHVRHQRITRDNRPVGTYVKRSYDVGDDTSASHFKAFAKVW